MKKHVDAYFRPKFDAAKGLTVEEPALSPAERKELAQVLRLANATWKVGQGHLVMSRGDDSRGSPTEVLDIGRSSVTLTSKDGHTVRAKHAVFATGYEVMKIIRKRGHRVASTWALATAAQPKRLWPSDPYLYARTTLDGRVIAGGEDEDFSDEERRDALIPQKVSALRRKLGRLIPGLDTTVEFAWAGCFGQTSTGLPLIGAVPGYPRCFTVLGYGGNGTAFSAIAAQLVQRAIVGVPDPDQELFAF